MSTKKQTETRHKYREQCLSTKYFLNSERSSKQQDT